MSVAEHLVVNGANLAALRASVVDGYNPSNATILALIDATVEALSPRQTGEVSDLLRLLSPAAREHYISKAQVDAFCSQLEKRYALYDTAMVLVSERHGKFDLIRLVYALLCKANPLHRASRSN